MTVIQNREDIQRRFGFVSLLLWLSFGGATMDAIQYHHWSVLRIVWITISFLLAVFFTSQWWKLKKGREI